MYGRCIGAAVVAALTVFCTAGSLSAQQRQLPPAQLSIIQDEDQAPAAPAQQPAKPARRSQSQTPAFEQDPNLDAADQLAPSQVTQPMPAAVPEPIHAPGHKSTRASAPAAEAMAEPAAMAKPSRPAAPQVVTCSGVFGKDSSHRKLALAFQPKNVAALILLARISRARARGAPTERGRSAERPARAAWAALRLLSDVAISF